MCSCSGLAHSSLQSTPARVQCCIGTNAQSCTAYIDRTYKCNRSPSACSVWSGDGRRRYASCTHICIPPYKLSCLQAHSSDTPPRTHTPAPPQYVEWTEEETLRLIELYLQVIHCVQGGV